MTKRTVLSGMIIAAVAFAGGVALSQEKKSETAKSDQPTKEQMEAHDKGMAVGPAHKDLAKRVGEYTTVSKSWMQPGSEPSESKGTAKLTMTLGGRFLQEEDASEFRGAPTAGLRIYGFNNNAEQYEAMWMYTQSTAMMTMTGTSTGGGKTVTYDASFD